MIRVSEVVKRSAAVAALAPAVVAGAGTAGAAPTEPVGAAAPVTCDAWGLEHGTWSIGECLLPWLLSGSSSLSAEAVAASGSLPAR